MTTLEIILLVIGGIIFVVSFFLPAGKEEDVEIGAPSREELKKLAEDELAKQIEDAKQRIADITDETITYAMEKGERAMERVTNEKMLAMGEYSDTVLGEIEKNQKEVVFLYDMLNTKHDTLLETVSRVNAVVSDLREIASDDDFSEETDQAFEVGEEPAFNVISLAAPKKNKPAKKKRAVKAAEDDVQCEESAPYGIEVQMEDDAEDMKNNNEIILEMHKDGKSNVSIARDLGLGVGEVKLVIDLFEAM